MSGLKSDLPTFSTLPPATRAYVAAVVLAGASCVVAAAANLRFENPVLCLALLALAIATSAATIELPLGRSHSTPSLSHVVNFWALFALGPSEAICIATVSAWAQCTLGAAGRNPLHRLLFSIGSLTLTTAAAAVLSSFVLQFGAPGLATLVRTAAIVSPVYFFLNTAMVAAAIALSTRQSVAGVWQRNFLWSAPGYLAGAALAAFATASSAHSWSGWVALMAVPLYLIFRSIATVVARLREEQQETRRAMDAQLETIEALALAIEAKAGCTRAHPLDPALCRDPGRSRRPVGPRIQGVRTARCCTTSATWRCPNTSWRSRMR